MRRQTTLLIVILAMALACTAFAEKSKNASPAAPLKMSGTIVSSSSSQLVIKDMVKGKTEETTFVVNSQTKMIGAPAAGERAVVRYKNENNQKVATEISAHKQIAAKGK